ncbi:MAG TPA: glycosyltransferase [Acidobacteriota bacterium]|jgi:glycosyltransferase involved in cell wall biosynthesis|nr:glycosyltransferase [Acidobacteriota bacterium]
MTDDSIRLAIMGTRGIPARYGGFETFAEELSVRLVNRGHQVTVYCRSHYTEGNGKEYRGVSLVVLPALPHKYLDTVSHSCISVLHGLLCRYDAVLMCNAINAVFTCVPRAAFQKVALNVDGIERQRKKWNRLGKLAYLMSERLATWFPHVLVADARVIHDYYQEHYGTESVVIPYGAPVVSIPPGESLRKWNLAPRCYLLYISRLEPENHAHTAVEAFRKVKSTLPLLVVGDAPYSKKYISQLRRLAQGDGRIIFTGAIYGDVFQELISNALLYVQATEVGGTHPALLQAMGAGNIVIANDTPEHHEVLDGAGIYYRRNDAEDLALKMETVLDHPGEFQSLREAARQRVRSCYSWESVTDRYEKLFRRLVEA